MKKNKLISNNELFYLTTIEDTFHFTLFTAITDLIDKVVNVSSRVIEEASQYDVLIALQKEIKEIEKHQFALRDDCLSTSIFQFVLGRSCMTDNMVSSSCNLKGQIIYYSNDQINLIYFLANGYILREISDINSNNYLELNKNIFKMNNIIYLMNYCH